MTIGDKIRSMNDEELAKLLIGCIDANYDRCWDEPYILPILDSTIKPYDFLDLMEGLRLKYHCDNNTVIEFYNREI